MKKLRVMVCGVGFGRYYIEAILRLPDMFELVGILSRGSKNSIKLAEKYSVPLMTNIEKISKENVDVACVVVKSSIVGGNGTDIVMELLEKGIHVIQEQPIHSEEYKKCLIAAKKKHCKYQLNTFYPYLDSVRKFISVAIRLRKTMPITYVIAESSVQVLFPLLDILNQILGGVQPYKLEKLQGENAQRFSIFNWLIKKCPVTLIVDNQMDVTAPESNLVMFHRITLGTPRGTLMLTDTHGSVLWTPVFHEDLKKQDKLGCDEIFQIETQEYVNDKPIGNLGDIVTERWPNCMVYVLKKFYQDIVNENYISSENQQLLTVCEIWNKIGELLGIYEKVEIQTERPCKLDNLIK